MRRAFVIPILMLSLLCGCVDAGDRPVTSAPQVAAPSYTRNEATVSHIEVIPIEISGRFKQSDRAPIERAVNEWNTALNGFVRFEIVAWDGQTDGAKRDIKTWTIMAAPGNPPASRSLLAFTYPVLDSGGLMAVYVDHIGRRDLGSVVMHELGHVLGLEHDARGGLMAVHYHPDEQRCVDKAAVTAVAATRGLSVDQLNWCESGTLDAKR